MTIQEYPEATCTNLPLLETFRTPNPMENEFFSKERNSLVGCSKTDGNPYWNRSDGGASSLGNSGRYHFQIFYQLTVTSLESPWCSKPHYMKTVPYLRVGTSYYKLVQAPTIASYFNEILLLAGKRPPVRIRYSPPIKTDLHRREGFFLQCTVYAHVYISSRL